MSIALSFCLWKTLFYILKTSSLLTFAWLNLKGLVKLASFTVKAINLKILILKTKLATSHVIWNQKSEIKIGTNIIVWMYCSQKTIFILSSIALNTFNDLITIDWSIDDWEKKKIYIWNELHSIVVVKYKHSSILARSPTGEWRKLYHSARKRSVNILS